jgi:regulator of protease activity HflC (stomatin/prohibitin superfamily)
MEQYDKATFTKWVLIVLGGALIILFLMFGLPEFNVWQSSKQGQAELAQADYNRQIAVREADAKAAAAVELAKAEVIRARGVAKANKIIGDSLNNNESYLTYLWIQNLESPHNKVIYVPTEANLPILEASRLHKPTK